MRGLGTPKSEESWGRGEPPSSTDSDTGAAGCTGEASGACRGRETPGGGWGGRTSEAPRPSRREAALAPAPAPASFWLQPPPPGPRLIAPRPRRVG